MIYEVRSRDLKGISYNCMDAKQYYLENKKYFVSPNSLYYGYVLVKMKRVFSGISFKIQFYFRDQWYWLPSYRWKPRWGECYFHWLFFMIWFEKQYRDLVEGVEADHLQDLKMSIHGLN